VRKLKNLSKNINLRNSYFKAKMASGQILDDFLIGKGYFC